MESRIRGRVVIGKNSYCGPFAVGYCAGVSPDEVSKHVRTITGQKKITDMGKFDVECSLEHFGCEFNIETPYQARRETTLKEWFSNRKNKEGRYIVFLHGHFVVIDGDMLYDNNVKFGVPVVDSDRLNNHLHLVWEVS